MNPTIEGGRHDPYCDGYVRETARRIQFLVAAAGRYAEPARFLEDLRRVLSERAAALQPDRS
jgi:hypothetical protein